MALVKCPRCHGAGGENKFMIPMTREVLTDKHLKLEWLVCKVCEGMGLVDDEKVQIDRSYIMCDHCGGKGYRHAAFFVKPDFSRLTTIDVTRPPEHGIVCCTMCEGYGYLPNRAYPPRKDNGPE